jgi:hypothetical protein
MGELRIEKVEQAQDVRTVYLWVGGVVVGWLSSDALGLKSGQTGVLRWESKSPLERTGMGMVEKGDGDRLAVVGYHCRSCQNRWWANTAPRRCPCCGVEGRRDGLG